MNTIAKLIPMSAEDMQRRRGITPPVNSQWVGHTMAKTASPFTNPPQETRPIPPNRPTGNLVEAPYRGWSADTLNTYIIPPYDQQQLALFSKYILKDPNAEPYNDLVSRAMKNVQSRQGDIQKALKNRANIKQAYRAAIRGSTKMNPTAVTDSGTVHYRN